MMDNVSQYVGAGQEAESVRNAAAAAALKANKDFFRQFRPYRDEAARRRGNRVLVKCSKD